ncbi:MAG: hypothetical protein TEF_18255 [Rhizobiales bacterium NRL2]|jgi:hemin uptake protein HemP|nr:MAG: hypothetical protein TEF_18255 [Rhizobiales bacterium NRL2]
MADPSASCRRPPTGGTGAQGRPRFRSEDLLGDASEIEIDHGGEVYRLRRTHSGKLILTK